MAAYAEAIPRIPTAPESPTIASRAHDTGYRGADQSELRDVSHLTDGCACCTTRWRGRDGFTKRFDLGAEGLKRVGFRLAFLASKNPTTNSLENTSYDPATCLNALRARSAVVAFGSMPIARSNWARARAEYLSFA